MIAQLFHRTSAERKTLLVAGAAAGMSATFAAPVASVLLDLLKARTRHLEEERRREPTIQLRFLLPGGGVSKESELPASR